MTGNETWRDLAVYLKQINFATPVIWLGDDRHETFVNDSFPGIYNSLNDFKFSPEKYLGKFDINEKYLSSTEYIILKDRALKMMDRIDSPQVFNRIDREAVFHLTLFWSMTQIKDKKIDFLLMVEAPHSYPQFIFAEYCRYMNIKAFHFQGNPLCPLVFFKDYYNNKLFKNSNRSNFLDKNAISFLEKNYNDIIENSENYIIRHLSNAINESNYWTNFKKDFIYDIKDYIKKLFKIKTKTIIRPDGLSSFRLRRMVKTRKRDLKFIYERTVKDIKNENYIYFALHYEPERSTLPDGNDYHDQLKAISVLRKIIPEVIPICVKEHPATFISSRLGHVGRSLLFYQILSGLKNVYFFSDELNTKYLIDNSILTVTITGTAALEAALRGCRAMIFGDAWYSGIPNVINYDKVNTYEDILSVIPIEGKFVKDSIVLKFMEFGFYSVQNPTGEKRFNYNSLDSKNYFFKSVYETLKRAL